MEAHITKRQILKNIPSASGLEIIGDDVFIIGDDSPYLFLLDRKLKFIRKILITPHYKLNKGKKIPKAQKPDLEALTSFDIGGEKVILILGSGSVNETRDKAFIVELGESEAVNEYSLIPLYNFLRKQKEIVKDRALNIEAATVVGSNLYLFQRGNITGTNVIVEFPLYSFIHFLQDKKNPFPEYKIFSCEFETCHGLVPGFSGATCIPGKKEIMYSASLEDTVNEWYDGEVFKSYLGILSENLVDYNSTVILESGIPFKGKVESLAILKKQRNGNFDVLAITDSDGGVSEVLCIEVRI